MTKDRGVLKDLARLALEEEVSRPMSDPRWEELCAGELGPEETAALLDSAESTDASKLAHEVFRPLGKPFHERVARRVQEELAATEPVPKNLLRFPRASVWKWALPAALAASLLLFLWPRSPNGPLPSYQYELREWSPREMRGIDDMGPIETLVVGSRVELLLRPEEQVEPPLEAQMLLEAEGELRQLSPEVRISESGSVLLTIGGAITERPGKKTLWLTVGRPGTLPGPSEVERRTLDTQQERWSTDDWELLRIRLAVVQGPVSP